MALQWTLTLSQTQMAILRLARLDGERFQDLKEGRVVGYKGRERISNFISGSRMLHREGYLEARKLTEEEIKKAVEAGNDEFYAKLSYECLTEKGECLWRLLEIEFKQAADEHAALTLLFTKKAVFAHVEDGMGESVMEV